MTLQDDQVVCFDHSQYNVVTQFVSYKVQQGFRSLPFLITQDDPCF